MHKATSSIIRRRMIDASRSGVHDRPARGMADVLLADDIAATFHEACARERQSTSYETRHGSHRGAASQMAFTSPAVHQVVFYAISVDGPDLDRSRLSSVIEQLADPAAMIDLFEGRPRALVAVDGETCSVNMCERMRAALGPLTRISVEPITPKGWFRPFRDSDRVLNLALALNVEPKVHRAADFPIEFAAARTIVVREHLVAALEPVMSKDNLRSTLLALVRFGGNRTRAAEDLRIHRSTIDYRLDRIKAITGYSPLTLAGLNMLSTALAVYILTA
ncbi:PucR family transcriptional regulator [Lentzea flaviverrucosa]|uniref:PucR family transcriptional regulator n=1 Tax=Lentzea flaviverrucosa TaxID=200379 RepID=UPI001476FB5C|nr:PucR family transcriptional regulator [Lentzea flaviverrucosa]